MREIKFRAWTGGEMRTDAHFCISEGVITTHEDDGACGDPECCGDRSYWDEEHEDWILMQYTGLKDKNGKEIYEGDIVNRFYSDGEVIGKLEIKIPDCFYGERKDMEVIGNIHENPVLIGMSKII